MCGASKSLKNLVQNRLQAFHRSRSYDVPMNRSIPGALLLLMDSTPANIDMAAPKSLIQTIWIISATMEKYDSDAIDSLICWSAAAAV